MRKGRTDGNDCLPSDCLLYDSFNVWQIRSVLERWQAVVPNDAIDLGLYTLEHIWIEHHGEIKRR